MALRMGSVRRSMLQLFVLLVCVQLMTIHAGWLDDDEDHEHEHGHDDTSGDYTYVTLGSMVKLQHRPSGYFLHSHGINYGSGSGQQSVTGMKTNEDPNSLWTLRRAYRATSTSSPSTFPLSAGTPIACNSIIRLQHVLTKRYLHSHQHHSPLTHRQEVSGYGDTSTSDTGDDWRVECVGGKTGDLWMNSKDFYVSFVHVDTNRRLFTRRADMFTQSNCPNCPIVNQLEISAHMAGITDENTQFAVGNIGGFFPVQTKSSS